MWARLSGNIRGIEIAISKKGWKWLRVEHYLGMMLSKDRAFYPEQLLSVGWQHMHTSSPLPGPLCVQGAVSRTEVLMCQQRSTQDRLGQARTG